MRVAALYSGGKDSTLAIHKSMERGDEVVVLLTARPKRSDSWMFHTIALDVVSMQAEAMGMSHKYVDVSGEKEEELIGLAEALSEIKRSEGIDGVVTGAIASNYQKSRIDEVASKLGIKHITPNWGMDGLEVLREVINREYVIIITAVSAWGLDKHWIGKLMNWEVLNALENIATRHGINLAGEGGELETLVLDCPLFSKRLSIDFEPIWLGDRGYLHITHAELLEKRPKQT